MASNWHQATWEEIQRYPESRETWRTARDRARQIAQQRRKIAQIRRENGALIAEVKR